MSEYSLQLHLRRDTTFGRGDGVAGLVDIEVEHDEYGLPFVRGRALKGLLVYECAEILCSLREYRPDLDLWYATASFLFGEPNSDLSGKAQLHIGNAYLPQDLRDAVAYRTDVLQEPSKQGQFRVDVLNSLTTLRRQTAIEVDGAAREHSLRTSRLIQRETSFFADLYFMQPIENDPRAKALLAACVKALHRGGTGRNRGPGLLEVKLMHHQTDITDVWFKLFKDELLSHLQEAVS